MNGYLVMWRTEEGVFSYVAPGQRVPFVASTPEELSGITTVRLPDSGVMELDTRYIVSAEYARREFLLEV